MKASLRILVSISIVSLLSGVVNSQSSTANKSEAESGAGNVANSSTSPVFPVAMDPPVTAGPSSTEAPAPTTITTTTTPTPSSTTTAIPTSISTTASTSTSVPTTSIKSSTSASTVEPTTTKIQPTTTKSPPPPPAAGGRRFDAPSFFGGIILAFGLLAICYVAFKFYRSRTEHNYHSLQETVHM